MGFAKTITKYLDRTLSASLESDVKKQNPESNIPNNKKCAVILIDASASMDESDWPPTRLEAAKEAALAFAQEASGCHVSIVHFSLTAKRACGLIPASDTQKLTNAVSNIKSLTWTNITAALIESRNILAWQQGTAHVLMLTDGDHNTLRKPYAAAKKLRAIATLEIIGIGQREDINEALMKDLASEYPDGSKRYRWIGDKARLIHEVKDIAGRLAKL